MKNETMKDDRVTYTLERDGKFYIIENVPARVCVETGEEFFAPETVDRLQKIILTGRKPKKTIETPIFEFAA
ncbi:MAG: type II toxin-antitoxin system MqsA family antitoxin [Pyrinomonadaceae bacterium]|nr:type II toxin-antitoxin system MqsA family antitoxin [Pyrinomonadaceae bacterium]